VKIAPHKRGIKNHNAKLDQTKVRLILGSTLSNAALGRQLGVSPAAVSNVRTGRTWSWLDDDWDDDNDGEVAEAA
jgi:hypothetical protein